MPNANRQDMKSRKAKIYYSPLGYLIHFATLTSAFLGRKCIIYGYRCKKTGKYLKSTRIASTTILMGEKNLVIEDNVWINHYSWIDASGGLTIHEGCQIGFSCGILSHSSHIALRLMGRSYMQYPIEERKGYIQKPTEIGAYTFIGSGSYILPGVKIGKGCIIGVNSVVTKDVPDYAIVAGVPAKIIGNTQTQDAPFLEDGLVQKTYYQNITQ